MSAIKEGVLLAEAGAFGRGFLDTFHLNDSTAGVLVDSSAMLTSFALFASLTHSGGGFL